MYASNQNKRFSSFPGLILLILIFGLPSNFAFSIDEEVNLTPRESLNICLTEILEKSAKNRNVNARLSQFEMSEELIRPLASTYGFVLGYADSELESKALQEAIIAQGEQVGDFLADFHVDTFGSLAPGAPATIEFVHKIPGFRLLPKRGKKIGTRLLIVLPKNPSKNFKPITAISLRADWDSRHFKGGWPSIKGAKRWAMTNPVGDVQILARQALLPVVMSVRKKFKSILSSSQQGFIQLDILNGLISLHTNPESLDTQVFEVVKLMDDRARFKLLEYWIEELGDTSNSEAIIETAMKLPLNQTVDITVRRGLISWGNWKSVRVHTSPLAKYVQSVSRNQNLKAVVGGLLWGHFTVDDIEVHLDLARHSGRSTESYCLDRALLRIQNEGLIPPNTLSSLANPLDTQS